MFKRINNLTGKLYNTYGIGKIGRTILEYIRIKYINTLLQTFSITQSKMVKKKYQQWNNLSCLKFSTLPVGVGCTKLWRGSCSLKKMKNDNNLKINAFHLGISQTNNLNYLPMLQNVGFQVAQMIHQGT